MMCGLPDAHEGPEEAGWCENPEHMACQAGTAGCSVLGAHDGCETY